MDDVDFHAASLARAHAANDVLRRELTAREAHWVVERAALVSEMAEREAGAWEAFRAVARALGFAEADSPDFGEAWTVEVCEKAAALRRKEG